MEMIYPIFRDAENMENPDYKDKFPTIPFPNKPRRPNSGKEYRRRLEDVCVDKTQYANNNMLTVIPGWIDKSL